MSQFDVTFDLKMNADHTDYYDFFLYLEDYLMDEHQPFA